MSTQIARPPQPDVDYPDSDGQPMAENTLQWEWIATIKHGLDELFRHDEDVFVAGDLLWYPVEGDNTTRTAPDALVAFGRLKGYRGSYMQWREGGVAPQVVFEVLSPGNRAGEMAKKFQFYETYGVEEYYVYDPDEHTLEGWLRDGAKLQPIPEMDGWVSPRLGVRFDLSRGDLTIYRPDGRPIATYLELAAKLDETVRQRDEVTQQRDEVTQQRDEVARQRDEVARQRDEVARQREAERQRAEQLATKLRALGIDPEA
jgi:Uma2 family endonuclease